MKLSKKSIYALRGLTQIGLHEGAEPVRLRDLAKEENIPFKFLEEILRDLANVGILRSKRGSGGGYFLNRPARKITLGEIIRLLNGPLAPIDCVSKTAYTPCSCPNEATCGLRSVMQEVQDSLANILDHTTVADLCERTKRLRVELSSAPARKACVDFVAVQKSLGE